MTSGDNRYFPREFGRIDLQYLPVGFDEAAAAGRAWLQGLWKVDAERQWRTPDPFMDFSASGLCFLDAAPVAEGELLLLELRLPVGEAAHRATGRVVRAQPLEGADLQGRDPHTRRIAVDFVEVSTEAVAALVEFTDQCQTAALGADLD